jgi:hypothetical protein
LKSGFYFIIKKHWFHILHFHNSTRLFTKPTSCHYTKYRLSLDIDPKTKMVTIIGVMKPRTTYISSIYGHIHPNFVIFGDISSHFFLEK